VSVPGRNRGGSLAAPAAALALVLGIGAERALSSRPAGDADAYHAAVRALARLPERVGAWTATRVEVPPAAVAILEPNVLESRRYRNEATGETATLLVVQCRDARDMSGHYPPVCYPAHGWTLREATPRRIDVAGTEVAATAYRFTVESVGRFEEIVVYNFFVRPGGAVSADRTGLLATDKRRKPLGAAQVQVVFDSSVSEARREGVFGLLVAEILPLVEAIRAGGRP
jgi:hypothetical protein